MIDSKGNKINTEKEQADPEFVLAEIKFFMKYFRNRPNDAAALSIAEQLNNYLKTPDRDRDSITILEELEQYSKTSENVSFLWQLIYARREIANRYKSDMTTAKLKSIEHQRIASAHFDRLCEFSPTHHHLCCRVREYTDMLLDYILVEAKDVYYAKYTTQYIEYLTPLVEQLEKAKTRLYYSTKKLFYFVEYTHAPLAQYTQERRQEALKKLLYNALELYRVTNYSFDLEFYAKNYIEYAATEGFCYDDERQSIDELIAMLQEKSEKGSRRFDRLIVTLNDIKEKFTHN